MPSHTGQRTLLENGRWEDQKLSLEYVYVTFLTTVRHPSGGIGRRLLYEYRIKEQGPACTLFKMWGSLLADGVYSHETG